MNKRELINEVATAADVTKRDAEAVISSIISAITGAVSRGEGVELGGLMMVRVTNRAARTGRNPKTGETVQVAARRAVTIKPAAALKAAANKE